MASEQHKAKILVVDDEADVHNLVRWMLEKEGYEVHTTSNGVEALEALGVEEIDLIISDIRMPEMDGWTLLERLRGDPDKANIPFMFLTSMVDAESERTSLRLGADFFIRKPFNRSDLLQQVNRVFALRRRLSGLQLDSRQESGFAGRIDDLSVPELLQIVELGSKSGTLHLSRKRIEGQIGFNRGRIFEASITDPQIPPGQPAVESLLNWKTGRFSFDAREVPDDDLMEQSISRLLLRHSVRGDHSRAAITEEESQSRTLLIHSEDRDAFYVHMDILYPYIDEHKNILAVGVLEKRSLSSVASDISSPALAFYNRAARLFLPLLEKPDYLRPLKQLVVTSPFGAVAVQRCERLKDCAVVVFSEQLRTDFVEDLAGKLGAPLAEDSSDALEIDSVREEI